MKVKEGKRTVPVNGHTIRGAEYHPTRMQNKRSQKQIKERQKKPKVKRQGTEKKLRNEKKEQPHNRSRVWDNDTRTTKHLV